MITPLQGRGIPPNRTPLKLGQKPDGRRADEKDRPTKNRSAVIRHAYGEISKVAEENGVKLIIVILGEDHQPVSVQKDLLPNHAVVVDAHSALLNRLPTMDIQSYQREYNHWRGDPPSLVDGHPNEKAHRIIAEKIVNQIMGSLNKIN